MDNKTLNQIRIALGNRLIGLTEKFFEARGWKERAEIEARMDELLQIIELIKTLGVKK